MVGDTARPFLSKSAIFGHRIAKHGEIGSVSTLGGQNMEQRGRADDREELYTFGHYRICKADTLTDKDPPEFLRRPAWVVPGQVGWIIDDQRQVVGVALSWGNMRPGLLFFPEGPPRPSGSKMASNHRQRTLSSFRPFRDRQSGSEAWVEEHRRLPRRRPRIDLIQGWVGLPDPLLDRIDFGWIERRGTRFFLGLSLR